MSENRYRAGNDYWAVPRLIQYVKEKNYPIFDLPLAGICVEHIVWDIKSMQNFIHHANRINKADLKYPILLDEQGYICDGWHRVVKAFIEGKSTIKAIRIQTMPEPDGQYDDTNKV